MALYIHILKKESEKHIFINFKRGNGIGRIILKNVDFSYGKNKVLQDINIVLEKGVTALLGPNGAGKTTLINIIMAI